MKPMYAECIVSGIIAVAIFSMAFVVSRSIETIKKIRIVMLCISMNALDVIMPICLIQFVQDSAQSHGMLILR